MKVSLVGKNKNELRVELAGEGHTFCNALQEELLKDETLEFGGYSISHPLTGQPVVYIRTTGRRKPETVLAEGTKNLVKTLNRLQTAFDKEVKRAEKT